METIAIPSVETQAVLEDQPGLIARFGGALRSSYESVRDNLKTYVALGAVAFVGANAAELSVSTEAAVADAPTAQASKVLHRHSKIRTQGVINKIFRVLHEYSDDQLQNDNCDLGGYNPFPSVPCAHNRIVPTSAFLTPSAGGFKTDCKNPAVSTYHFYKINPFGQNYHTCGPGPIPGGLGAEQKTEPGEFQGKLNRQANAILQSVGIYSSQIATRLEADRRKATAKFLCPSLVLEPVASAGEEEPAAKPEPLTAAKQVTLRRNHTATVVTC